MEFNAKITPTTLQDAGFLDVVAESVVEGGGVAGSSARQTNLKLNMIKHAELTCDGAGTSTDVLFANLDLPDMLDTDFSVVGGGEAATISSKATTGFTFAHGTSSTLKFDVLIIGNWDE